jgi:hypothetical protein
MTRANEYERALARPDLDVGKEGCQLPAANRQPSNSLSSSIVRLSQLPDIPDLPGDDAKDR